MRYGNPHPRVNDASFAVLLAAMVVCLTSAAVAGEGHDYKRWLKQEVVWIISQQEQRAFKDLRSDEEREEFIEAFWKRRDPTPRTDRNEYREEHYRRWRFANEHFQEGVPGWKSDRGRVYILHGPPDSEYYYHARNVMSPTRRLKATDRSPDSLVWTYHENDNAKYYHGEIRLVFQPSAGLSRRNFVLGESRTAQERADEMQRMFFPASDPNWLNGDVRYRLVDAGPPSTINARGADLPKGGGGESARYIEDFFRSPGDLLEERAAEMARREQVRKELRDEVAANIAFDALELTLAHQSYFRQEDDWWIPLELSIPITELKGRRLDIYAALLDQQDTIFDEFVDSVQVPRQASEEMIYRNDFSVPSGNYTLRVVLREVESRRSGSCEISLQLRSQRPDEITFGSVFLTDRVEVRSKGIEETAAPDSLAYGDVRLLPHRRAAFAPQGNLFAYLQFWVPNGERKIVLGGNFIHQGQIVRRLDQRPLLSSQGGGMDYGTVIPLSGFEPGEYVLQFQLLDVTDRKHDFKRVHLVIGE